MSSSIRFIQNKYIIFIRYSRQNRTTTTTNETKRDKNELNRFRIEKDSSLYDL